VAGQGTHWQDVQSADIARYLQPGRNVLAVEATNTEVSPAGLIARLEIRRAGSAPIVIVTDAAWKSSDSADAAWQTPDFDDKGWTSASVSGAFGAAPWGAIE
jgi:alpha-L-rhamnosidase